MYVILLTSSAKSCSTLIHFVMYDKAAWLYSSKLLPHNISKLYGEDTIFISPSMLNHRSHKQCSQQLRVGEALAVM